MPSKFNLKISINTVATESIQTPLNFSPSYFIAICQNHLSSFFPSLLYTQHPILTEKHRIVDIFARLLKKKN